MNSHTLFQRWIPATKQINDFEHQAQHAVNETLHLNEMQESVAREMFVEFGKAKYRSHAETLSAVATFATFVNSCRKAD